VNVEDSTEGGYLGHGLGGGVGSGRLDLGGGSSPTSLLAPEVIAVPVPPNLRPGDHFEVVVTPRWGGSGDPAGDPLDDPTLDPAEFKPRSFQGQARQGNWEVPTLTGRRHMKGRRNSWVEARSAALAAAARLALEEGDVRVSFGATPTGVTYALGDNTVLKRLEKEAQVSQLGGDGISHW
jgi:hypothetical protein